MDKLESNHLESQVIDLNYTDFGTDLTLVLGVLCWAWMLIFYNLYNSKRDRYKRWILHYLILFM